MINIRQGRGREERERRELEREEREGGEKGKNKPIIDTLLLYIPIQKIL